MDTRGAPGNRAMVGHVGRRGLTFALTGADGRVDPATRRFTEAASSASISGAIAAFQREHGLSGATLRSALAIAGLVRGDSISVTHTRWYISRSGLHAMLGHPPILLNDFEAEAWALAEPRAGDTAPAGTFVIAGMTSGMGVSVLRRQPGARAVVLATEAGHAAFTPPTADLANLVAALFPGRSAVPADTLVSAPGLAAIYRHLAGAAAHHATPEAITAAQASDPAAHAACRLLATAFAGHVGNLVLACGAWDGVIASGGLATAIRPHFDAPEVRAAFAGDGKYARILADMPWRIEHLRDGELAGAAAALAATDAPPASAPPEAPAAHRPPPSAPAPRPALRPI